MFFDEWIVHDIVPKTKDYTFSFLLFGIGVFLRERERETFLLSLFYTKIVFALLFHYKFARISSSIAIMRIIHLLGYYQ